MSNAKQARPEIFLKLDKPRKFIFNLNGLCTFKSVNWKDLGVRDVRLLLWAGLIAESPELTQEEVGELLDVVSLGVVFADLKDLINLALDAAMPHLGEDDLKAIEDQKKKLNETGRDLAEKAARMTSTSTGSTSSQPASTPSN
jgi:hypothetical protein